MRGIILSVCQEEKNITVEFHTDIGTVKAPWIGEYPQVGREYFVELEVSGVLRWGEGITLAAEQEDKIGMIFNSFVLIGRLEEIENNGLANMRLAGCLVTIENSGVPYDIGSIIRVVTKGLVLYDIHI